MANETKLMQTEEEICEGQQEKLAWSDAVAIIEVELVNVCESYIREGDDEIANKVEEAWLRILRG